MLLIPLPPSSTALLTSAMSSRPTRSASARAPGATAVKSIASSLARSPHQRGLRTTVTVPDCSPFRVKGPESSGRVVLVPLPKAAGVAVAAAG